jgi:Na+-transporting NADH:ubiquinone oxidoreductase subunit C
MSDETLGRTLAVAIGVALGCSLLVSTTVYFLRPMQIAYAMLERNRTVAEAAGLIDADADVSDREIVNRFLELEARLVDLDSGGFSDAADPLLYDQRAAAGEPAMTVPIAEQDDIAGLGRRVRLAPVYLLRRGGQVERVVLPIHGRGMWSTIYGYISLEADVSTIAGVVFFEHGETPGIGDRIQDPGWLSQWIGKRIYDDAGELRFGIAAGAETAASSPYAVDGISGASVTVKGVGNLVRFWLGDHGFAQFLARLRSESRDPAGPR